MTTFLQDLLNVAETKSVSINGKSIPIQAFAGLVKAIPQVIAGIATGQDSGTVIKEIVPEILPLVETLASAFFPGAGDGIALAVLLLSSSHRMTSEEEAVWFARQGSDGQGG